MDGLNFRPLTFAEEPLLRRYLSVADSLSCEMSLANLLLWLPDTGSIYTEYKGRLLIAAVGDGLLFFPLGEKFAPSELAEIFAGIRGMGIAADDLIRCPSGLYSRQSRSAGLFSGGAISGLCRLHL